MRILIVISLIAAGFGLAIVGGERAYARTRTPTPTATPTITATPSPTPCPTVAPTLSPDRVSKFSGEVWLYIPGPHPPGAVTARIGDTLCSVVAYAPPSCGQPPMVVPPSDPGPLTASYAFDVLPASAKRGCGYEGAPVTFYVGKTQATATAVWHAGTSQEVNLTTGPPFAFFRGELAFPSGFDESTGVRAPVGMYAFIGDNVCGREIRGVWKGLPYYVVVYSDEQQAGCGMEGAQVTFTLRDRPGNIIGVAREKGVWHAWGVENAGQELNLTMDPVGGITIGNVGTGESQHSGTLWRELSLVMAAVGLGGFAAGAALRRRAQSRPTA